MAKSKFINTFDTTAEYENYIESAYPAFPNVGYDKQADKVNIVRQPHSSHLIWGTTNETSDFTVQGGATFTVDAVENIFYTDTWDNTITNYYQFFNNAPIITIRKMLIDTSSVTEMSSMFVSCPSLTSLDLSNFNTSNVTNMYAMFAGCSSLTSLDLSNFDTSNVTDMGYMFLNCSSLTSLDLSNFNTSNVRIMEATFAGCSSLTSLDLSNCDFSNVADMNGFVTFSGCNALTDVYITVEATLNKLTNNLSSQGNDDYIPSSAIIHYNGVDYKWQNNAWTPQN